MVIQYLQSFIAGILISLSGSLPLGNLNVAAMQIAAGETLRKALWFAIGVTVVEMVYLGITTGVVSQLNISGQAIRVFHIISIAVLLIMAIGSFMAVTNKQSKNVVLNHNVNRLVLGAAMSAINPLQIPFWLGWITYLLTQSLLINSTTNYIIFTLSAGIGTFAALLIFIIAGRKFAAFMQNHKKTVNVIIGLLFTAMAAYQLLKLV